MRSTAIQPGMSSGSSGTLEVNGGSTRIVMRLVMLKPGSTSVRPWKVRIRRPAPIRTIRASAISPATKYGAGHSVGRACEIARSGFQSLVHIRARGSKRRQETKENSGRQRQKKGECEHTRVHLKFIDSRDSRSTDTRDEIDSGDGQRNANASSGRCQQKAFGQQLADDAATTRSDGHANCNLTFSGPGPGQQHVDNIRTNDQEDESNSSPYDHQGRTDVADNGFVKGLNKGVAILVRCGIGRGEPGGDRTHFRLCGNDGGGVRQACNDREKTRAARVRIPDNADRRPDLGACVGKGKTFRGDADDRTGSVVKNDRVPDHIGRSAKVSLPEAVRNDDTIAVPRSIVFGDERPAQNRFGSDGREEAGRHRSEANADGYSFSCQVATPVLK